jgi:hypothetical protein
VGESKEAVTPDGTPETASVTLLLKPFHAPILMRLDPVLPAVILKLGCNGQIVKLGSGSIVNRIEVELVSVPAVPRDVP